MKSNFDNPSDLAQGLYDQLLEKVMEFEGSIMSSTVIGVLEMLKLHLSLMNFDTDEGEEDEDL